MVENGIKYSALMTKPLNKDRGVGGGGSRIRRGNSRRPYDNIRNVNSRSFDYSKKGGYI